MERRSIGTRINITNDDMICKVTAGGNSPRLYAAAITHLPGRPPSIEIQKDVSSWQFTLTNNPEARITVIVYMAKETEIGRVQDRGPITCSIGNDGFELEPGKEKQGATILAEIYTKNNQRYMRVRGDGYNFGIKALARKEGLPLEAFIKETYPEDIWQSPQEIRQPRPGQRTSSGSGVVVDRNHVITNAHVVENGQNYVIHGPNGDLQARLVAIDKDNDLAILKTQEQVGDPLAIRKPGTTYLGEPIVASGYPLREILGEDLKMTHGNISGMKGQRGNVSSFQFTAPIGSGSSGGAVTDTQGNLVGIITSALAHDTMRQYGSVSENTNFAIKASLVIELMAAHGISWIEAQQTESRNQILVNVIRNSIVCISVR